MKEEPAAPFHLITAVWGAGHSEAFVELGLPTLMAPKNLPGLRNRSSARYHIFTRPDDLDRLERAESFQYLKSIMPVVVDWIDEEIEVPHLIMSDCHRRGLRASHERRASAVFVPPDCIWSDGSFTHLEALSTRGYRVIHISGIRLVRDGVVPHLRASAARAGSWDRRSLSLPARELVRFGLSHLHAIADDTFFRERSAGLMPANLLWSVGDDGIYARCFHLHPLLLAPSDDVVDFRTTIDDDLALAADPAGRGDYVVGDSDEILTFELSPLTHQVLAAYQKGSILDVAAWAEVGANPRHRELVKWPIRIHAGDIDAKRWRPVEREAEQVVTQALWLLGRSSWYLLLFHRRLLAHRAYADALRGGQPAQPPAPPSRVEPKPKVERRRPRVKLPWPRTREKLARPRTRAKLGWPRKISRALHRATVAPLYRAWVDARRRSAHRLLLLRLTLLRGFERLPFLLLKVGWRGKMLAHQTFSLIFGESPQVRPWHWRWAYERQVLRPFLASLRGIRGRALVVDGSTRSIDPFLPENTPDRDIVHVGREESPSVQDGDGFDLIFVRQGDGEELDLERMPELRTLLRAGGRLVLQGPPTAAWIRELTMTERGLALVETRQHGGLGSACVMGGYRLARRQSLAARMLFPIGGGRVLRQVLVLPFFVLSPIVSVLAETLNFVAARSARAAETELVLEARPEARA